MNPPPTALCLLLCEKFIEERTRSFPAPGSYDATLFVDGDPVARRKFTVQQRGSS